VAPRKIDFNQTGKPMEDGIVNAYPAAELTRKARRALVECGLWLRVGFIGASGVAAGLIQLVDGSAKLLPALALAVGGSFLAAASWWRARAVLEDADKVTARTTGAPSAASDRVMAGT
jgi:hypothetical protein